MTRTAFRVLRDGQRGTGLLELLVSVMVLAVAIVGLFAIATTTTSKNTMARDQVVSMQLAVDKMEELRNTAFASLASGSDPSTLTAGGVEGGVYTRSWTVASRTVAGIPVRDLTVSVHWEGGGTITLTSSVAQPNTIVPGLMTQFSTVAVRSWDQRK